MNKTSKRVLIGLALLAIPAGVLAARHGHHRYHWGHHGMFDGGADATPETRARLLDGRIAMAKESLKLSPDQVKLWTPLEEKIRAAAQRRETSIKERQDRRAARDAQGQGPDAKPADEPSIMDRLETRATRMSERSQTFSELVAALKPLYATFSEEQKAVAKPLMRQVAFGGGHKGWRHGRGPDRYGWGKHNDRGPDGDRGGPPERRDGGEQPTP